MIRKNRTHAPILRAAIEKLEGRALFAATPYLVPSTPGVTVTPVLTVGETGTQDSTYRMVGIPDGLGAYDNGDGTFTVLMNHELGNTAGVVRDHGAKGAFVSKWVIKKDTLEVLSGDDLIKNVKIWNPATSAFESAAAFAFNRFCSADLPDEGAFYDPETGLGTTDRIFTNGEETTSGKGFAHIVTGALAGTTYELPYAGKFAWENAVASPYPQSKTILVGLDDSSRNFSSEGATDPSEVYFQIGNKLSGTGNPVADAGLLNGTLYGMKVANDINELTVASGERFTLVDLGDQRNKTAAQLQADSIAAGITQFRRVEDGHFDPNSPNDFYFVTTDNFGGTTRMWKIEFDDITNPTLGGTITIAHDSPPGSPGEMFDNMAIDRNSDALIQEDPGGNAYLARIWHKDLETGDFLELAKHNPALFDPTVNATPLTIDEESSGIIDVSHILGEGRYLVDVQAHYNINSANPFGFTNPDELVQGGQLLVINTNNPTAVLSGNTLKVTGTLNDEQIAVYRSGATVYAYHQGLQIGSFNASSIKNILVEAGNGNDWVSLNPNLDKPAVVLGGNGNDRVVGSGKARNILIGEAGNDQVVGRNAGDILIGNRVNRTTSQLIALLNTWTSSLSYTQRINAIRPALTKYILDDKVQDWLTGNGDNDWFLTKPKDLITDLSVAEIVN
jgi:hypothetical protein